MSSGLWDLNPRPPRCQRLVKPEYVFKPYDERIENEREYNSRIEDAESLLAEFKDFMRINMRLERSTVQNTLEDVRRCLRSSNCTVSYNSVASHLKSYLTKASKTYNSQITSLRRFIRDFLSVGDLISSFKMAPVDEPQRFTDVTKKQVKAGFQGQPDPRSKAIYLFTATTGLRKGEILNLR